MPVKQRGGSWQAAFSSGGKRYRRQFPTQSEAKIWEAEAKAALARGEQPNMGSKSQAAFEHSLGAMLDLAYKRYWSACKDKDGLYRRGKVVATILGSSTPIVSIDAKEIDYLVGVLRERSFANSTINRHLAALGRMFTAAERYIPGFRRPRMERLRESEGRLKWFTLEEERALIRTFREMGRGRIAQTVKIAIDTRLRRGEVLSLSKTSSLVEIDGKPWFRVRNTKSGKDRFVPLTRRVRAIVRTWPETGRPYNVSGGYLSMMFRDASEVLGQQDDPEWVFHTLRHTFCTRLAQRGVDVLTIMKLAGHSSPTVTMRYIRLANTGLSDAIQALEAA